MATHHWLQGTCSCPCLAGSGKNKEVQIDNVERQGTSKSQGREQREKGVLRCHQPDLPGALLSISWTEWVHSCLFSRQGGPCSPACAAAISFWGPGFSPKWESGKPICSILRAWPWELEETGGFHQKRPWLKTFTSLLDH